MMAKHSSEALQIIVFVDSWSSGHTNMTDLTSSFQCHGCLLWPVCLINKYDEEKHGPLHKAIMLFDKCFVCFKIGSLFSKLKDKHCA